MLLGDVVDQFHDHDRLAHAGAAEHADLAALGVGADQVDDLDARLQDFRGGGQFLKGGGGTVNVPAFLRLDLRAVVHHVPQDVEDPAQGFPAHGHGNALAGIRHGDAALQAVRGTHGDAADRVVADMLGHLHRQGVVADGQRQRVVDCRQPALPEMNVHHGAHDLGHDSCVLIQSPVSFRNMGLVSPVKGRNPPRSP